MRWEQGLPEPGSLGLGWELWCWAPGSPHTQHTSSHVGVLSTDGTHTPVGVKQ